MAKAGELLENPIIGIHYFFLKTAQETNGELLRLGLIAAPGVEILARFLHPNQEKRFEVFSGRFLIQTDDKETVLEIGDTLTVAPGVPHHWKNIGNEDAYLILEFSPALNYETFLETVTGLGRDGKLHRNGIPKNLLQLAVTACEFESEIQLARIPAWLQKPLFRLTAFLGRKLGYQGRYPSGRATRKRFGFDVLEDSGKFDLLGKVG